MKNTIIKDLKIRQFGPNHLELTGDGFVALQSYDSIVAVWDTDSHCLTLGKHWDYSATTSRYLYKWLDEQVGLPSAIRVVRDSNDKKRYMNGLIDLGFVTYDEGLI